MPTRVAGATLKSPPTLNPQASPSTLVVFWPSRLGTMASLPASPPSPPAVCSAAGELVPFENFVDGLIDVPAIAKCLPDPSRAMPAGFHQTVVASSATAAAPA